MQCFVKTPIVAIPFSAQEYRALIDLLAIANTVIHPAGEEAAAHHTRHYVDLIEKIYAHASDIGADDMIEYCQELGRHFTSAHHNDIAPTNALLNRFTKHRLWETLIDQLATRDLVKTYGEQCIAAMPTEQRAKKSEPFEEIWASEFEKHGLNRISVKQ